MRSAAGRDAVLRVLEVDPRSRVPERRAILAPFCRARWLGSQVYWPRPVAVRAGDDGVPVAVGGVAVEAVREEWLVEDRWWTPKPLQRRYFELVLADGRDIVVFREPPGRDTLVRAARLMAYVELHAHSAYSFFDGASLPEELATAPRPSTATRPSRSPTTTTSAARWSSPRRAGSCACARSTAPS